MNQHLGVATIISLLFMGSGCQETALERSSSEIIGGQAGSIGEFPTTVVLGLGGGLCTGTLIAPDLVLTAAHCITPSLVNLSSQQEVTAQIQIVFDTTSIFGNEGKRVSATETIPHPGFSTNGLGDNDIGLIRLSTPVLDREPTPINRFNEDAPVGIKLTQVGYGATQVGGGGAGSLRVLKDKQTSSCSSFGVSDVNLLCFSQVNGTGKCQGDSGGPSYLMVGEVQRVVGVTSFGDMNCAQFGADTRVDAELDFLYEHAPELKCQVDGACNEECGSQGLPEDDDCELCTNDSECEGETVCNPDGKCVSAPFSPGGEGATCGNGADCDSALCAKGGDEEGICTSSCQSDDSCLDGFECIEAGAENVCWPKSEEGGCSTGGSKNRIPGLALLFVALALGLRRRKQFS